MCPSDTMQKPASAERRHLFLTGEKRVGKSTAIRTALADFDGLLGGFRTMRTILEDGRISVHLLTSENDVPSGKNRIFFRGDAPALSVKRFDALGCAALEPRPDVRLILLDELGPNEQQAYAFQQAVFRVLNGEIPVLGVLQQADVPFLRSVADHPRVSLLTVTEENRDKIPNLIRNWLP